MQLSEMHVVGRAKQIMVNNGNLTLTFCICSISGK